MTNVNFADLKALGQMPSLKSLVLRSTKISLEDVTESDMLNNLTQLDISKTSITNDAIATAHCHGHDTVRAAPFPQSPPRKIVNV